MSARRVYLSGPIAGLVPVKAEIRFRTMAEAVAQRGHGVLNPFDVPPVVWDGATEEELRARGEWAAWMRGDLARMLTDCDSILLLGGWQKSKGAALELYVAQTCGLDVVTLFDLGWLGETYVEADRQLDHEARLIEKGVDL